jgi:hypothetical protein
LRRLEYDTMRWIFGENSSQPSIAMAIDMTFDPGASPPDESSLGPPRRDLDVEGVAYVCPKCRSRDVQSRLDGTAWCRGCGEDLGSTASLRVARVDGAAESEVPRWAMVLAGLLVGGAAGAGVGFFVGVDLAVGVVLGGILGGGVGAFTNPSAE